MAIATLLVTGLVIGFGFSASVGEVLADVLAAGAWSLALAAVFAPLAVGRYRHGLGPLVPERD